MPLHDSITSFNAGELSPYVESRTSLEKYRSGCKVLENYLITPYGPINRRAGTQYLGSTATPGTRSRLIALNLSDSDKFVMELGVGYARFWKDGALQCYPSNHTWDYAVATQETPNGIFVTGTKHFSVGAGTPIQAVPIGDTSTATAPALLWEDTHGTQPPALPYQENELREVSVCQINNVVYLTHPNHPPMRLSYWGLGNAYNPPWTVGPVSWKWPAMLDQNYGSTTITPSGTTGFIVLTASAPIWNQGHEGAFWEITHPNSTAMLDIFLSTSNTSGAMSVQGDWNLQTFGTWFGTVYLDQSTDGGATWNVLRTYFSHGDYNATSNGTSQGITVGTNILPQYRLRFVADTGTPSNAPRAMFQPTGATLSGFVKVINYISPTQVNAQVYAPLASTSATTLWREGAFSSYQGYPAVCALHESRVLYAGTNLRQTQFWGSYSGDFENFQAGAHASDSYSFALASQTGGRINWVLSKSVLLLGTTQDEWYISGGSSGAPISPGNVFAQKQSHYGSSEALPAFIINDTAIYVQRMGRKIREFVYAWQTQTWVSVDLTSMSSHITQSGIAEMAYQRVPDAILWVLRNDGTLVPMVYEREQQVTGFSRVITNEENGDAFESVATINSAGGEDEVWVIVRRNINGGVVRYVERFRTGQRDALDQKNTDAYWYLDCAKATTQAQPFTTISGLDHLNGQKVSVWASSAIAPLLVGQPTVVNGTVTLQDPAPAGTCLVGLPFTSLVVPEQFQRDLQEGTSAGRRMRIVNLNLKIYNSQGGEYSADGVRWFNLPTRRTGDLMDAPLAPYSGYERVSLAGNWRDGADFYIRQSLPMPLTVVAVVGTWETSEVEQ